MILMQDIIREGNPILNQKAEIVDPITQDDINLLKEASLEELEQILPKKVALNLYNKIHYGI